MNNVQQELEFFEQQLMSYHIPRYEEFPSLELYKDQIILVLSKNFAPFVYNEEEPILTSSMINNYVKQKIAVQIYCTALMLYSARRGGILFAIAQKESKMRSYKLKAIFSTIFFLYVKNSSLTVIEFCLGFGRSMMISSVILPGFPERI